VKAACTVWVGAKGVKASDLSTLLLDSPHAAKYLLDSWKKIRKFGGLATGITSNINRVMDTPEMADVLSNSEFVVLLKQPAVALERLQEL